jgi:hypothetical protein
VNGVCPPAQELERLLAGQLSEAEEQTLENHVVECEACRQRLDGLTDLANSLRAVPLAAVPLTAKAGGEGEPAKGGVLVRLASSSRALVPRLEQPLASQLDGAARPTAAKAKEENESPTPPSRISSMTSPVAAAGRFLRRQVWTWPLIAAAILGGAGWWVGYRVESSLRDQRINELTTVLKADVAAIRSWMNHQRDAAASAAADDQLRPLVQELLAAGADAAPSRAALVESPAQAAIRARLQGPLARGNFTGFVLVSPSGVTLADDDAARVGTTATGYRRDFFQRVAGGEAAVSKPFQSPLLLADDQGQLRVELPSMCAAAPINDGERTLAVLGLRIRPDDQFTRILQVARSGASGETYAFDRRGLLLSQSRFDEELREIGLLVDRPDSRAILNVELRDPGVNMVAGERPAVRRSEQPLTVMAQSATQGHSDHNADGYRDYRGVPVVGAWLWLDEYDFGVATEIDVAEAFAPVYILRRALAVLLGLLAAAAAGIFGAMLLIARQQRMREAAAPAEQFGQYTLMEKLGTGGMGTVYKARHALLRRPTAIKLLNPNVISDTAIARFEREVQLTSGLTHPNTVAIYDYGRTSSGVFYYAMEFLEGINLDELVKQYGSLPEARAVYVLRQVCASLAEAHAAGLVHRDVKPANIVLTIRGGQYDFVKVLDFGLARLASENPESGLTMNSIVAGTPLFISPEAITQPQRIDVRADVYALGAVAYFLLTGTPVFVGSSATDICLMHVGATPQPPSARTRRPISPKLEALLLRCLAKSPADRPDNAAELLRLLDACPISGTWTPEDAARWWADRDQQHFAATQVSQDPELRHAGMACEEPPSYEG